MCLMKLVLIGDLIYISIFRIQIKIKYKIFWENSFSFKQSLEQQKGESSI